MRKSGILIFAVAALALSVAAGAQGLQHSEISLQVSGLLNPSSNGTTPSTHLATNSAGLLLGYRLHITSWEGVEFEYGYTRNGQRYIVPSTAPGTPATNFGITTNMQELVGNEVITTPRILGIFQPFLLAGGGALIFSPRGTSTLALSRQTRGALNAGAGLDFHVGHMGARAEFQELWFKIPDFGNPALATSKWTHVSQPSVGLILTF